MFQQEFSLVMAAKLEDGLNLKEGNEKNVVKLKGPCHTKIHWKNLKFNISLEGRKFARLHTFYLL